MYYQVGNQCLEQSQAENVYFSLVVPTVTEDGRILKPEYNGTGWQLDGQVIKADLPQCSPEENLKDGLETGWLIFGVMAACYVIIVVKRMLR
ncbi:hypothetical protein [Neisseria perflava]|uniref:hypothetical protein n=1 Tax=Neisseria perflava TaxID=33053 RepID=UPI00209D28E5|nr:hypothetical protein [Neisseria perflava]MCP1661308.1 hypothetical protein [Neisseria perflava]MCP1773403.1 hypothetical protein [Neisseria perflava]